MNVARPSSASRSTRQRIPPSSDNTKENHPSVPLGNKGNYHPPPLGNRNADPGESAAQKQTAPTTAQPLATKPNGVEEKPYETIEERKNGVVVRRYLKGKLLGKGGFAKAYWATCLLTQKQYAMKVVLKATLSKPKAKAKLQAEVKIHASLRHQFVVRFHHFFEDDEAYYMVLELAHNKSFSELMKKRKRLTQPEVQYYMWQILDALLYLHGIGVIHRDLKLGNLLLDKNMRVKIGDLGLAATVSEAGERKRTLCGTPNYIAPEILENKHGHSFQVDIWSTGVVLYTMLVGRPPYESKDVKATYKRILANDFAFPDSANLSSEAKDLISSMLQTDPAKRPSIPTIQSHSFFVGTPDAMPASALHSPPAFAPSTCVPTACSEPAAARLPNHQQQQQLGVGQGRGRSESAATLSGIHQSTGVSSAAARAGSKKDEGGASSVVSTQPDTSAATRIPSAAPDVGGDRVKRGSSSTSGMLRSSNDHTKTTVGASSHTSASSSSSGVSSNRTAAALATDAHPRDTGSTAAVGSNKGSVSSSLPPRRRSRSRSMTKPSTASKPTTATTSSSSAAAVLSDALNAGSDGGGGGEVNPLVSAVGSSSSGAQPRRRSSSSLTQHRQGGAKSTTTTTETGAESNGSGVELHAPPQSSTEQGSLGFGVTRDIMAATGGNTMTMKASTTGGIGGEMGTLESIHNNLATTMAAMDGVKGRGSSSRNRVLDKPTTWVTQYVDYTSKYGLGYLLADGSVGVYFNDSTKIVLSPSVGGADQDAHLRFQYMERVRSSDVASEKAVGGGAAERFEAHTLGSYPPALHKKVTLLQHFRDYLIQQHKEKTEKEQSGKSGTCTSSDQPEFAVRAPRTAWGAESGEEEEEPMVFVKKWVRTRHAILFRLSNQTVQVMFLDNTEVVLSSEATVVTYADKQGMRKSMALHEVMELGRSDIIKRLKYTKDILRQLISSGKR